MHSEDSLLGTLPCSRKRFFPPDSESRGRGSLYKAGRQAGRQASRHSVTVRLKVRMGKTSDKTDFEPGMIIGARRAGSNISETAGVMGFSCTTQSRVYQEWPHPCLVSKVQAGGGGVMVWGMFSWPTFGPLIPIEQRWNVSPCRIHVPKNSGCSGVKGGSESVLNGCI